MQVSAMALRFSAGFLLWWVLELLDSAQ